MNRPRSLHVCRGIDPQLGGTSVCVPALARYTSQDGRFHNSLAVFRTPHDGGDILDTGMPKEAITEIAWRMTSPLTLVRATDALRQIVRTNDIVHIHGLWQSHTILGAWLAHSMNKPYLISAHGMLDSWAINHKRWKKLPYAMLIERRNLRQAACLMALTHSEVKNYREFGIRAPIALIPNGVQAPQTLSPSSFHAKWPELRGKRIVLFLSRIHSKKGLVPLCQAWQSIVRRSDDLHLVLAGPDQDNTRVSLESLIEELGLTKSITFTGMLDADMKWSVLSAATVFVLPSYSEGFSVAILEALSAGKPVVITKQCNFPELLGQEFAAVTEPDADQLQAALASMLALPSARREAYGQAARSYVEDRYSWPKIGSAMAEVYEWLLGGRIPSTVEINLVGTSG